MTTTTTPNPFAEWFTAHLAARDWSPAEFTRQANGRVNRSTLTGWLNYWAIPKAPQQRLIAETFGVPLTEVRAKVAEAEALKAAAPEEESDLDDLIDVPVLGGVSAGGGMWFESKKLPVPKALVQGTGWALFRVRGDSMAPEIPSGEMVLVNREREAKPGNVVIASTPDGLVVKRLERENGRMLLRGNDGSRITVEDGVYLQGVVFTVRMV